MNGVFGRKQLAVGLIALFAVVLAACNSEGSPTSEAGELPIVIDDLSVIADGRLIPIQSTLLSFNTGGVVQNGTVLTLVPAPGALALLGVAGLLARRRRRA